MTGHSPLISTIVLVLVLAFALGALAHRFKIAPIAGYLLAGVILGPFTPGYVADQHLADQLAEIGVILLMFGVGLHFSLEDLLSVRTIAIPGALLQMVLATLLGVALGWALGWPIGGGLVFGIALSIASTVVVLRALQERRLLETERGRIAVGWLVVEDIVMVFVLVLLPPLSGALKGASLDWTTLIEPVGIVVAKIAAFVALMLLVGKRLIPWILHYVAHTGSRELFRLAVLAIALGVAFAASTFFGVSFALGAFFAGMIMSESALSQRAASESLPLRDAFAVLFFASVGMLFDPTIVTRAPLAILATLFIIVVAKAALGFGIVRMLGQPRSAALMIAASRAQIGEFSFILAGLGVALSLLPETGRDLILAGAILSLLINPFYFAALDRMASRREAAAQASAAAAAEAAPAREPIPMTTLFNHVVLIGFGRVGGVVGNALIEAKTALLVIEDNASHVERLRQLNVEVLVGNAADPEVVRAANFPAARCLLVAIPDGFEGGQVVEQARALNAALPIIARAHSEEEVEHLKRHGATSVIMGENLIADAMIMQTRAALVTSSV
jgi:CPA2 family monovalent cation:H+ antiporter-2